MSNRISELQQLKTRIMACLQAGRAQEAHEYCEQLSREEPSDAETWFMLGAIKNQLGQYENAITCCRRASELRPDLIDPHILAGNIYKARKDLESASSCYQDALALQPGHAGILNNLGSVLSGMGQPEKAEDSYRKALQVNPRYAEAYNNLGTVLRKQGKLDEAVTAYRQALHIKPDYPVAHNNLGNVLKDMGCLEDSVRSYQSALQLNPGYSDAHSNLGTALKKMRKFDEAIASYQQALQVDPRNLNAHLNLGNICQEMNRLDEACAHYRRALKIMPDFTEAWKRLGIVMQKQGRRDEAAESYRQALRTNPVDETAQYLLATVTNDSLPAQAPAGYVRELFDYYSDHFDEHLTGELGYRTPEYLHRAVLDTINSGHGSLDILDLGCGTGLCGPLFHNLSSTLVGVDLSPGMIAKAEARKVYSTLLIGDINNPPLEINTMFDLILAADVFVYLGELTQVFQLCRSRLRVGGLFAFSIEAAGDEAGTYILNTTGRYAHAPGYIRNLSSSEGFTCVVSDPVILRHDKGGPVHGYIYVLRLQSAFSA